MLFSFGKQKFAFPQFKNSKSQILNNCIIEEQKGWVTLYITIEIYKKTKALKVATFEN